MGCGACRPVRSAGVMPNREKTLIARSKALAEIANSGAAWRPLLGVFAVSARLSFLSALR